MISVLSMVSRNSASSKLVSRTGHIEIDMRFILRPVLGALDACVFHDIVPLQFWHVDLCPGGQEACVCRENSGLS